MKDKKIAMMTRRSMLVRRTIVRPSSQTGLGHRIVPCSAQRVAAHQTPRCQPSTQERSVAIDGLRGIVRTGGQEPAPACEIRRETDLVPPEQTKSQTDPASGLRAA